MNKYEKKTSSVLVVDDEVQTLQSCSIVLRTSAVPGVICCNDSREVMSLISDNLISVILLDLSMPYISGQDLLKKIVEEYPEIPVIIITGANDVETAVDCMKNGAFDYMVKPVERSRLVSGVKRAVEVRDLRRENLNLKSRILDSRVERPEAFSQIITNNRKMLSTFQYVEAIAGTTQPVFITGETGVGKELMARAVHSLSGLKGEFVGVNVSGLDDHLFADSLFGHARGAFTGASEPRGGFVEKAAGGTLFLDEIGDLSSASQVKLLRLMQEGEYFPLGSDIVKRSSARIIVATNRDVPNLLSDGIFRKDLYYRLQTHRIHIPPLRKRKDDLPLLVDYFLREAAKELNKKPPTPPREMITLLSTYHFPGNLRELRSMIFDAVSKHKNRKISLDVFKERIFDEDNPDLTPTGDPGDNYQPVAFSEKLPSIREATRLLIEEAMKRADGNQSIAAGILGISQQALSRRLKNMD